MTQSPTLWYIHGAYEVWLGLEALTMLNHLELRRCAFQMTRVEDHPKYLLQQDPHQFERGAWRCQVFVGPTYASRAVTGAHFRAGKARLALGWTWSVHPGEWSSEATKSVNSFLQALPLQILIRFSWAHFTAISGIHWGKPSGSVQICCHCRETCRFSACSAFVSALSPTGPKPKVLTTSNLLIGQLLVPLAKVAVFSWGSWLPLHPGHRGWSMHSTSIQLTAMLIWWMTAN